jgi:sugar/nucleoside kinase (ribokinase family)
MLVCALGDLLLDVIVRLDDPIAPDTDAYGRTHVGAGGQAANVAAWVAALGGRARLVGKRARDGAGRLVAEELELRGVELVGPEVAVGTGTVVSVATPDGGRTMLSDRGVAPQLHPMELEMAWFRGVAWLHLPGYSLVRAPVDEAAAKAAGAVRAQGGRISVDLSSAAAIREFGPRQLRRRLEVLEPDLLFANEDERALLPGELPAPVWVLKRGPRGIAVGRDGSVEEHPAPPAELVDTTGAGDALAAGFLVGGAQLGLEAAARCVATMGAMP